MFYILTCFLFLFMWFFTQIVTGKLPQKYLTRLLVFRLFAHLWALFTVIIYVFKMSWLKSWSSIASLNIWVYSMVMNILHKTINPQNPVNFSISLHHSNMYVQYVYFYIKQYIPQQWIILSKVLSNVFYVYGRFVDWKTVNFSHESSHVIKFCYKIYRLVS